MLQGLTDHDVALDIWSLKYRHEGETRIAESLARVARAVAAAEPAAVRDLWERRFLDLMNDFAFLPAGRILAGAGSAREVTLFNCFVMGTIGDSIPGIFDGLKQAAQTLQQGGGIGHDFSTLRPKGALVHGVGADASGPLSFMDVWDAMCRTIMSAGARRGAMMGTLRCDHPDIEDFIEAKRDPRRLRNFNLSVLVTDAFMQAVAEDGAWPLVFGGKIFRTLKARALWDRIMRATYDVAEPGVIFIDRINRLNPLSYCETISCTNPCGEQPLPPYGACLLGSLNLTRFVANEFAEGARLDVTALKDAARTAIRFLDDVVDVSNYPLPEQRAEAFNKRRLGLGVTGLADALFMCGLRYGSPEAAAATGAWMLAIKDAALEASAGLAEEKGAFPLFDADAYLATPYGQSLSPGQRDLIARKGLRNGLLTSIAPTGTISLIAGNVSSGVEPIFSLSYDRRILEADGSHRTIRMEDHAWRRWRAATGGTRRPAALVTANDLSPAEHLAMQAAAQAHVDSSISKTINVPEDLPFEQFRNVYEEAYRLGLKGCTTFRPNAVTGSILSTRSGEEKSCPSCGSFELVAREGCTTCLACGFAVCG
ncbi:MAG: adenosylcobalamin-dependent ribonucleoside-diphosphate reductase [Rhizobiales bacterium]|nr:adenosylcobalamin-dependent ribonucleoside-diphosphate reductase [Hyphomicrobiales bacterium]